MEVKKLESVYGGNVSYYGKAKVIELDNIKYLKSYNTVVCAISNGEFIRYWDDYSATTIKHINDFCRQNGFNTLSKKEWLSIEVSNESIPKEVLNVGMNYKVNMVNGGYNAY